MAEIRRPRRGPRAPIAALLALGFVIAACGGSTAGTVTRPSAAPVPTPHPGKFFGVNYEPYTDGDGPGATVPDARIVKHLTLLQGKFTWIKVPGTTSGNTNVPRIAHQMGFKVMASAYLSGQASTDDMEIAQLEKDIDAGYLDLAAVGNEVLWRKFLPVAQLITRIDRVRKDVKNKSVPITTIEPNLEWPLVPELLAHVDAVVVNITPFAAYYAVDKAQSDLQPSYAKMVTFAAGKPIYIGETEWPSDGGIYGAALANPPNAARYFSDCEAWATKNGVQLFYYEAFDEPWLGKVETVFGNHWGIFTSTGVLKPGFEKAFAS